MHSGVAVSDDLILLQRYALDGNAAAFAELVRRYADLVYSTARRVTGSAQAAEDVAQDCFLRLAESSAAISGSVAAWLHRASLNRSLEMLRSDRARKRRELAAAERYDRTSDESREVTGRVDEALAALPDELRVILTDHFLCGKSQAELANESGLSQSTISRRIDAGLMQLREWLRKEAGAEIGLAALPMLFGSKLIGSAPQSLRASAIKIGMSGLRAARPAAKSHRLIVNAAAAATVYAAALGGLIYMSVCLTRPPAVRSLPVPASARSAAATNREDRDQKDEEHEDQHDGRDEDKPGVNR